MGGALSSHFFAEALLGGHEKQAPKQEEEEEEEDYDDEVEHSACACVQPFHVLVVPLPALAASVAKQLVGGIAEPVEVVALDENVVVGVAREVVN